MIPKHVTPGELAAELGWSERRVRDKARELGACRILGNRMVLLPDDVNSILEATKPCPSKSISVREAMSGTTEVRLPDVDSEALLAHLARKPPKSLRPRSPTSSSNVVTISRKKS
jgi:hypothetical protein